MNICTKPNLTLMKSRYPKTLEERQRILEVFRGLKTARSAQAYVRGNTEHYYRWLEVVKPGTSRKVPPSGSVAIVTSVIWEQ
jgi:hypothetical protein